MIDRRTLFSALPILGGAAVSSVAVARPNNQTPQDRIDQAVEEIAKAMRELYPDWDIQLSSHIGKPIDYRTKQVGAPHNHSVLIFATSHRHGQESAGVYLNYKD